MTTRRPSRCTAQALEITKKAEGVDHPDYATSLNNLAVLYRAKGDYALRRAAVPRGAGDPEEDVGRGPPRLRPTLNNLAALYQAMGDYARAEPLYRQALEIPRRRWARTTPTMPNALNNLAELYRQWATTPAPSRSTARRWRSQEGAGRGPPHYATGLNNLALLYMAMGDYARAEPLYRQALAIRKKALGEDHPDYARA